MKSEAKVVPFPAAPKPREREELAFLPAALEIVETPPSPIGRAIGATIIALFVLALAWATLGHVDIVATATGKIIPTGRSELQTILPADDRVQFVPGGQCRAESVLNGLKSVPAAIEWVAVHDGARPLVSQGLIDRTLAAASPHMIAPAPSRVRNMDFRANSNATR